MNNRWGILAVLFVVRATMAFQFQSVAAVAPLLGTTFSVSIADIGVLIKLCFAPAYISLFCPRPVPIGQKFGDKQTALGALLLMLSGSLATALAASWDVQVIGRLVAGAGGGVILSVQLTKMLTDWFAGREIATAMAILVNSWPAGIAVSLMTLPLIGTGFGVEAVHFAVAAFVDGIALIALFYRRPPDVAAASTTAARLDRPTVFAVIIAGLIWGLFNIGFAIVFSFGPSMLVERGWSIAAAGSPSASCCGARYSRSPSAAFWRIEPSVRKPSSSSPRSSLRC